ncbi:Holliday junction branch migration protein RuvA [Lapillicoccus sp.]|uniref:Holliday junction branch migration protein RuvA n=1 Tax=Lapillicoccus sp. TaxID=1909287 RepID=UPI003263E2D7
MIASLSGIVARTGLDSVVLEVGGVGMLVHTTPLTAASLLTGQPARLSTSLVVREDSLTLYGFTDEDERGVFETVQTVSGVGPRLALAMLAVHRPDAIRAAVSSGDLVALTKVPGVGRKGAERLVLELRDKMVGAAAASTPTGRPATAAWQGQVRDALVGLGWTARQADDAVEAVAPLASGGAEVSALLRAALQELGR